MLLSCRTSLLKRQVFWGRLEAVTSNAIERAAVKIFSGDIGNHRNAKYPLAMATIHLIEKTLQFPQKYKTIRLIHAIPTHKTK